MNKMPILSAPDEATVFGQSDGHNDNNGDSDPTLQTDKVNPHQSDHTSSSSDQTPATGTQSE